MIHVGYDQIGEPLEKIGEPWKETEGIWLDQHSMRWKKKFGRIY